MAAAPPQQNAADKHFDEIVGQSQNIEHYTKIFQEVIMDLENDEVLETFRQEYEVLHNSFFKCHQGEKRLIKKCQDLSAEISSCILKVRAADALSQGDHNTIDQLKKEISKARNKIEQSKETEVTLKEKIKQLKTDIKELDSQLKKGPSTVVGHDTTLTELGRVKLDLQKQHDTQKTQLLAIQHDITHLEGRVAKVSDEKAEQDNEMRALHQAIELKGADLDDQRSRKDRKEKDLKELKEDLAKTSRELVESQATLSVVGTEIQKREEQVSTTKDETDRVVRDLHNINKQTQKNQQELEEASDRNDQLRKFITTLTGQLKVKDGEVMGLRKEKNKQAKLSEAIDKRNIVIESQRAEAESERDRLVLEVQQMEMSTASLTKQAENDRKQIEDLTRERDILNKNYLKAQSATQRQKDWLMVKENQRRNLDHQIRGYERHAQKQRELIHQLAKEAKTYEEDAEIAAKSYVQALEDVRVKEQSIIGKQRDIQDVESKLRQQQTMLDTVLNERNLYAKNALLLQQEINEMVRKFRGMQTLIDSLKTEIKVKESELMSEETKVSHLIKEKGSHEIRIDNCKKITEKREKTIDAYNEELHKLNQIIAEADAEKAKQRRDHVNVMNERDILGAQLIKRNDELAQLYEQIRIQQSMLRKGEAQYGDRLRDIQHLNFRVQQLRQELSGMRAFASRLPDLRLLLNKSTRELTREQCRVRVLLDECDNPRNVHRYRRLEGSEPQTQLLFMRVKELQEELLEKCNEVEQKDRIIGEKEKLYVELKAIIQRQPGPEVAEQLNVYQDSLQKKTGQLRAMKDSLQHFQEQVEHFKSRHDELQDDMREMTSTYKANRKRGAKDDDRQRLLNEMMGRPADAPADAAEDVYVGYTAPPRPETEPVGDATRDAVVAEDALDAEDASDAEDVAEPLAQDAAAPVGDSEVLEAPEVADDEEEFPRGTDDDL
jgi:chromosome segregation ATPase